MKEQTDKKQKEKRPSIKGKTKRKEQIRREAAVTLWTVLIFFFFCFMVGYAESGENRYVFGLPYWFFTGGILGFAFLVFLVTLVVKTVFRNFDSEEEE